MSWKTVLYEYVHLRNQAEGESAGMPAMPFVRDDGFVDAEAARLARSREVRKERGHFPWEA